MTGPPVVTAHPGYAVTFNVSFREKWSSRAASFTTHLQGDTSGHQPYCDMAADYFGLKKKSSIDSIRTGTVALWVKFAQHTYYQQHFLSNLDYTANEWSFNRTYSSGATRFYSCPDTGCPYSRYPHKKIY